MIHYSASPDFTLRLERAPQADTYKPSGLWVSVGSSWEEWCKDEEFGLNRLQYQHLITLTLDANVLWLRNAVELDAFTHTYKYDAVDDPLIECRAIDWKRLAEDFDGLLITPYCLERRLDLMWYYGWDCASGCIWNPSVIATAIRRGKP